MIYLNISLLETPIILFIVLYFFVVQSEKNAKKKNLILARKIEKN